MTTSNPGVWSSTRRRHSDTVLKANIASISWAIRRLEPDLAMPVRLALGWEVLGMPASWTKRAAYDASCRDRSTDRHEALLSASHRLLSDGSPSLAVPRKNHQENDSLHRRCTDFRRSSVTQRPWPTPPEETVPVRWSIPCPELAGTLICGRPRVSSIHQRRIRDGRQHSSSNPVGTEMPQALPGRLRSISSCVSIHSGNGTGRALSRPGSGGCRSLAPRPGRLPPGESRRENCQTATKQSVPGQSRDRSVRDHRAFSRWRTSQRRPAW